MHHLPQPADFLNIAQPGMLVPVYRRLICDHLTPVSAFHRLNEDDAACLFESVIGGEKVGRYSFLAAKPFMRLEAFGPNVRVISHAGVEEFESSDPLEELRARVKRYQAVSLPGLPPFLGGAVGYAAYDAIRYSERLPHPPPDDRHLPDLAFAFFDRVVVFDHIDKTLTIIAMARLDQEPNLGRAYDKACQGVNELVSLLDQTPRDLHLEDIRTDGDPQVAFRSNFTPQAFSEAVEKCLEYIKAGDIFQVVLSQRLETQIDLPPFEIYRTLRVVNPSPFMFYLRLPQVTLVGSSPEILVRVVDGRITVRPLAGTRPRGVTPEEDRRLAAELLADEKERAEHVMLVDLGRNDVGRVSSFGSVQVSDVMSIERYSHVMHITSNVNGQLAPGLDAFDALRACLPAGTVSGAPKVRAMQIIDELEPHRRGPYAGAVGYIDFLGNMDTCIALRTMVIQGNKAYLQAGAGIVADSNPEGEFRETMNKARVLLKAIELTSKRLGR